MEHRSRIAFAAVAGLLVVAAACSSGDKESSTTTQAAAASASAGTSADDASASQVVDDLAAGHFDAVHAHFDATMTSGLPSAKLESAWSTFIQTFGQYKSHEAPRSLKRGDLVVEQVVVHMAQGDGEVRVTYHPDATIAGLYLLRPGVPVA